MPAEFLYQVKPVNYDFSCFLSSLCTDLIVFLVDAQYVEDRKTGVIPPMRFKPKEIRAMERGFSSEKFAENEFASVYRCSLSDGTIVAVKQLKPGAIHGESKFMDLINTMDSASHPNLNSLLGYCFTKDCQTLVFEFAENNNLSHHLHGELMTSNGPFVIVKCTIRFRNAYLL